MRHTRERTASGIPWYILHSQSLVLSLLLAFGWSVIASVVNKTVIALQAGRHAARGQTAMAKIARWDLDFREFGSEVVSTATGAAFSASTYYATLGVVTALHAAVAGALLQMCDS